MKKATSVVDFETSSCDKGHMTPKRSMRARYERIAQRRRNHEEENLGEDLEEEGLEEGNLV
jgi:hypothetical protein